MRPYLIINGQSSLNVRGLLIQELPPITKPQMRTKAEEIDGRDGDIVTKLGYKAYDKTVTIGLYGDFDVNEVFSYFAQGGKITFSNEIDKFYFYELYGAIDLNRLVRFRTGKIKLHVQPYKYDVYEDTFTMLNTDPKGNIFILNNKGNTEAKPKITITGNGVIRFLLNGKQIFVLSLNNQTAILDTADLNVKTPEGDYLNRQIVGSLEDLILRQGNNNLTLRGNFSNIKIENVSRWL